MKLKHGFRTVLDLAGGKVIKGDIVVIDSSFPQKQPFAFRNTEINEYFSRVRNFESYTMHPMLPDADASFKHGYGISYEQYKENKKGYLKYYPKNKNRIHYLKENRSYDFKLAYSFFLGETYTLLPFYEKNKIPFAFVLYPGGCFELGQSGSDRMLTRIFNSPYFRGVIVTQQITRDYINEKKLCPKEKITYIYGGFVQFKKTDVKPKRYYRQNKSTFDICFVAAKYTKRGVDKGYDLFIKTAEELSAASPDFRFHVVGGFDEADINIQKIRDKITFYGYRQADFLLDFYAGMDIFLAPNRPFKITKGNFDGFPLGIDASYCGTALFVADELKMNHNYANGVDIVIVPLEASKIGDIIMTYFNNPTRLYELSEKGQLKTQELFDINHQIKERLNFFSRYVNLERSV